MPTASFASLPPSRYVIDASSSSSHFLSPSAFHVGGSCVCFCLTVSPVPTYQCSPFLPPPCDPLPFQEHTTTRLSSSSYLLCGNDIANQTSRTNQDPFSFSFPSKIPDWGSFALATQKSRPGEKSNLLSAIKNWVRVSSPTVLLRAFLAGCGTHHFRLRRPSSRWPRSPSWRSGRGRRRRGRNDGRRRSVRDPR